MARDMESRFFAEPEFVDSSVDLGGYNPQILQNQFAVQPQTTAAASPAVDLGNYDFGGLGLGNYNFGNFDLSAFQPQYNEPVYSQPTAQPTQAVPYYEEPLVQEFVPPNRTYGYDPVEPASTAAPVFDFSDYKPQYLLPQSSAGTDALNKFIAEQAAAGKEYVPLNPYQSSGLDAINANIWNAFNPIDPNNPGASAAQVVRFDTGNKVGVPDGSGGWTYRGAAPVTISPGNSYTLTDAKGNVIGTGTTAEEVQRLSALADQGAKAGWVLYRGDPVSGSSLFNRPAQDNTLRNFILAGATAIGGATLAPWISSVPTAAGAASTVPTALGAGLSAGAINTAGRVLTGDSLGDALKAGAISGLLAGGIQGAINPKFVPNSLARETLSSATSEAAKQGASAVAQGGTNVAAPGLDEIVVNAARKTVPGLVSSGTAGTVSSAALQNLLKGTLLDNATLENALNNQPSNGGGGYQQAPLSAANEGDLILVNGRWVPKSYITRAFEAASGALSGTNYGDRVFNNTDNQVDQTNPDEKSGKIDPETGDIVVSGSRFPIKFDPTGAIGSLLASGIDAPGIPDYTGLNELAKLPEVEQPPAQDGTITVTAPKTSLDWTIPASLIPAIPALIPPGGSTPPADTTKSDTSEKKDTTKSTIGKVVGGLTIADALAKIISKIAGGGGGSGGTSPGGQQLQSVFSAKLPRASGIFAPENLAPRDMSGIDYYRYGFGPEAAFFRNVPTSDAERTALVNAYRPSQLSLSGTGGATSSTSAVSDPAALLNQLSSELAAAGISEADFNAYLQTPEGQQALLAMLGGTPFAKGGSTPTRHAKRVSRESFAVEGPGTGRSDEIPAVLSDGEYVIDAETVALLGDGSSKAGAKKLDEFRVNVRKHKGRNLAKGKFSVNAKRPEKYLSGGRT